MIFCFMEVSGACEFAGVPTVWESLCRRHNGDNLPLRGPGRSQRTANTVRQPQDNPSGLAAPGHLPLHKGGFGAVCDFMLGKFS